MMSCFNCALTLYFILGNMNGEMRNEESRKKRVGEVY